MDHQWIIKLKVLLWNGTKDHSTNDQKLTITVKNRRIFIGIFQIRISKTIIGEVVTEIFLSISRLIFAELVVFYFGG